MLGVILPLSAIGVPIHQVFIHFLIITFIEIQESQNTTYI